MSGQVYSVLGQTERRRKAVLEWKSIYLSSQLSSACEVMLTIVKVSIILRILVGIGNIIAVFKTNQQALVSIECQGMFPCWTD